MGLLDLRKGVGGLGTMNGAEGAALDSEKRLQVHQGGGLTGAREASEVIGNTRHILSILGLTRHLPGAKASEATGRGREREEKVGEEEEEACLLPETV